MPISVSCSNGHQINAAEKYAGRKVLCPKCKAIVFVPEPEPEVLESAYPERLSTPSVEFGSIQLPEFNRIDSGDEQDVPPSELISLQKYSVQILTPVSEGRSSLKGRNRIPIAFGCALLLVTILGTLSWMLSSKQSGLSAEKQLIATTPLEDQSKIARNGSQSAEPEAQVTSSEPQTAIPEPLLPSEDMTSYSSHLTAKEMDSRLECFGLPHVTFAAAYDEPTGRIAIANDTFGVLIFNIEDCIKGTLEPVATFPTNGLPNSVCLKRIKEKRFFIYSESNSTILHLVDADTLQLAGEHTVLGAASVCFLNTSSKPDDPYVYFSYNSNPQSKKRGEDEFDLVSRFNLETEETEASTERSFVDFDLSQDGKQIYARIPSNGAVCSDWGNLTKLDVFLELGKRGKSFSSMRLKNKPEVCLLSNERSVHPIYQLNGKLALDRKLYSLANDAKGKQFYATSEAEFSPQVEFEKKPVVFGLGKNELVFASPNGFRPICNIALPESWDRLSSSQDPRLVNTQKELEQDWRYRKDICVNTRSAYYKPIADNTRNLAIAVFDRHMIVVPLDRLDLPDEPKLVAASTLPETIRVGTAIELRLSDDKEVLLELMANRKGMTNQRLPVVGASTPEESTRTATLFLNASVDPGQRILFLSNSPSSEIFLRKKRAVPFAIQIGPERMLVQKIDTSQDALIVDRSIEMEHHVTSWISVFEETSQKDLPTIVDGVFRWTPSIKSIGRQNIRVKATRGETDAEWLFPVEILSTGSSLSPGFYIQGIEPDYDSTTAVIWGLTPTREELEGRIVRRSPSELALIDLDTGKVASRTTVHSVIHSAALHGSSVYATCDTPSNQYQLVEFNAKTLKETNRFPIQHVGRIQIIADKFVAITTESFTKYREKDQSVYRLPEMALISNTSGFSCPRSGRLGQRWVLDGVVWDKDLQARELLLFPSRYQSTHNIVATTNSLVEFKVDGPQAALRNAKSSLRPHDYQMRDLNVILSARGNGLHVFPHNPSGYAKEGVGTTVIPYSTTVILEDNSVSSDDPFFEKRRIGNVTENSKQVLIATAGKIQVIDKSLIKETNVPFRFEERQEKFVLDASKINTVEYSAKNAIHYKLSLWYKTPFSEWNADAPSLVLESDDGKFELQFDPNSIASLALSQAKISVFGKTALEGQQMVNNYVKSTSRYYKFITGQDLRTVPLAVTALVEAEHDAGPEKAALLHMFFVEPPITAIQKLLSNR